jgi:uncharacterized protein YqeY
MDTIRAEIYAMIETAIHDHNLASRAWVKSLGATDTAIINELTDHISKLHDRVTTLEKQVRKLFAQSHTHDWRLSTPPAIISDEELSATLRALISKIEQRRKQDV